MPSNSPSPSDPPACGQRLLIAAQCSPTRNTATLKRSLTSMIFRAVVRDIAQLQINRLVAHALTSLPNSGGETATRCPARQSNVVGALAGLIPRNLGFDGVLGFLGPAAAARASRRRSSGAIRRKGYGFLVPGDGSPRHLLPGKRHWPRSASIPFSPVRRSPARTAQGQRGPEVSRIHAVDFSTASPRTASFARTPGNGPIAAGPGAAQAGAGASGRRVRALVKWFMPTKGYGFLERSAAGIRPGLRPAWRS